LGSGEETFSAFRAGININLEGFKSNSLLSPEVVEVKPGKQKIVLDLPPLSNSDQLVTIELKNLQKVNRSTGVSTTVEGPWLFSFVPNVKPEHLGLRKFNVDKQIEIAGYEIQLKEVQVSSTETLVYYQTQDAKNLARESLGQPELRYGNHVLRGKSKYNFLDNSVLSFSPLPAEINHFTVVFPRMITLNGPGAIFTLPLEQREKPYVGGDHVQLNQIVEVNNAKFQFFSLNISADSFTLHYKPFPEGQDYRLLLAGPGQVSDSVIAMDDRGSIFPVINAGSVFEKEGGFRLREQQITFQGKLDPEASELKIKVKATGTIGEPFIFDIGAG
ncbi:MAG: hypothetical protein NUV31_11560, partial [Dehalococcoidales bacterium]|jgi:hypothetical protein|nr:hypothetical protein [Dehalococcoidales bacterium]